MQGTSINAQMLTKALMTPHICLTARVTHSFMSNISVAKILRYCRPEKTMSKKSTLVGIGIRAENTNFSWATFCVKFYSEIDVLQRLIKSKKYCKIWTTLQIIGLRFLYF